MDSTTIDLVGSEVEKIVREGDELRVVFSTAYLIKTLTGSEERTRWRQSGALVFSDVEMDDDELPAMPAVCDGGDVGENVYTYRDMLPVPLESRGRAHCDLRFRGDDRHLRLIAGGVRLEMEDRPYYIEHIRD